LAIELECEEVNELEDEEGAIVAYEMICAPDDLPFIQSKLTALGYNVTVARAEKLPHRRVKLTQREDSEAVQKFTDLMRQNEEVKEIYDNVDRDDE